MKVFSRRPRVTSPEDVRMSLIEHLEALRRSLIIMIIAVSIGTAIGWFLWPPALEYISHRAHLGNVYVFEPAGAFFLHFKGGLYIGIVLAVPVIVQQAWAFVAPGLYLSERRLFGPLVLFTILFFYIGVAFASFSVPLIIDLVTRFATQGVVYFPEGEPLLSFILALVLGFGVIFELPIVLYVLGRIGIISSGWMWRTRPYWIIGLGVVANLLMPGSDPFTPLLMMVPLYIFYEGTALLLRLTGR
jgi:sec-independent protein translocase protein TatC